MDDMDPAGVAELMRGLGLGGIAETVEAEQLTGLMLLQLIKRDGGLAAIGAENVLTQSKIAGAVEQEGRSNRGSEPCADRPAIFCAGQPA